VGERWPNDCSLHSLGPVFEIGEYLPSESDDHDIGEVEVFIEESTDQTVIPDEKPSEFHYC
jgi:hypothetical protein